jgi:hypothetical protein
MAGSLTANAALAQLVHHPDAETREIVIRQLLPSAMIPNGASWALVIGHWQRLLPELESQLGLRKTRKRRMC